MDVLVARAAARDTLHVNFEEIGFRSYKQTS